SNEDVWREIVSYLTISLTDDHPHEIKTKRRVLLSLALTARDLANITQDELWKSMTTLIPIVQVLNHFSESSGPSGRGALLTFTNDCWEMAFPSTCTAEELASCAAMYLSRIRYLHYSSFPSLQESTLLQMLSALCQGFDPLLPNLKGLYLSTNGSINSAMAYNIIPLLSPTLRTLTLHKQHLAPTGESVLTTLLDILRYRNIQIEEINCKGCMSSKIAYRIFRLPSLRSVAIPSRLSGNAITEAEISSSHGLALTRLDVHLALFIKPEDARDWVKSLRSISDVTLRGSQTELVKFLLEFHRISTVRSFGLYVEGPLENRQNNYARVVGLVPYFFPHLHTLRLEADHQVWDSGLDLAELKRFEGMQIQTVILRRCCCQFSIDKTLAEIIQCIPTLKYLRITAYQGPLGDARVILPYYSRHARSLIHATLPLQLSSLKRPFDTTPNESICPLRSLGISTMDLPTDIRSVLGIARNLLLLFPHLNMITAAHGSNAVLQDLQTSIDAFRNFATSFQRR
ncbi:hypothetical protein AN958_06940, partial [Leucoagaricus sp. SymC.cos]